MTAAPVHGTVAAMPSRLLPALCAAVLLPAAPAAAAPVLALGTGNAPVGDYDGAGNLHVAWVDADDAIVHCRVPAGATACDAPVTLPKPTNGGSTYGFGSDTLNLIAEPSGRVSIFGQSIGCGALDGVARYTRAAGASSFGPGVCKTDHATNTTRGQNTLDRQDRFIAGGGAAQGRYVHTMLPGNAFDAFTSPDVFRTSNFYDVSTEVVGEGAASRLVATSFSQGDPPGPTGGVFSLFELPPDTATPAQLNDPENWTGSRQLAGALEANGHVKLAGNGQALVAMGSRDGSFGQRVQVHRFLPHPSDPAQSTWSDPVPIPTPTNEQQLQFDADMDAGGRVHAIWKSDGGAVHRYARSDDGGATWGPAGTLTTERLDFYPQVVARSTGGGVMLAERGTEVVLVPLEPTADPPPATPPPATKPPATTPPAAQPQAKPVPAPLGLGSRPLVAAAVFDRRTAVRLLTPRTSCIAPGQAFQTRMELRARKRKGKLVVKLTRVEFFLGGRKLGTDTRAPFSQRLTVSAGSVPGSRIVLRARGRIKVKKGKARSRSISRTFTVCR